MDRNAYRDENDTGQPDAYQPDAYQGDAYQGDAYQGDAYWRRRVITLCAGLALLGLLAWAFSGGGGKPAAKKGPQASGARPAAVAPSFQPRFTASCRPVFMPWAPAGEWVCAASPASSIRPARYCGT